VYYRCNSIATPTIPCYGGRLFGMGSVALVPKSGSQLTRTRLAFSSRPMTVPYPDHVLLLVMGTCNGIQDPEIGSRYLWAAVSVPSMTRTDPASGSRSVPAWSRLPDDREMRRKKMHQYCISERKLIKQRSLNHGSCWARRFTHSVKIVIE
jgi:hypothetical protein